MEERSYCVDYGSLEQNQRKSLLHKLEGFSPSLPLRYLTRDRFLLGVGERAPRGLKKLLKKSGAKVRVYSAETLEKRIKFLMSLKS